MNSFFRPLPTVQLYKLATRVKINQATMASEAEADPTPQERLIPPEIWIKSFAYLEASDLLHSVALTNQLFLELSSDDLIWNELCIKRWNGKLNTSRFRVSGGYEAEGRELERSSNIADEGGHASSGVSYVASSIRRFFFRDDGDAREYWTDRSSHRTRKRTAMTYCYELIQQFGSPQSIPALNMGSLMHQPTSWKEAYYMAEMDACRTTISREELVYFQFQLLYMGRPSQMGLRQFNADGSYASPYMGLCEWMLHGHQLLFAGMSLLVERDRKNWGWIIGKGERTEYLSVERGSS